jgi:hypothetical protein
MNKERVLPLFNEADELKAIFIASGKAVSFRFSIKAGKEID